MRSRAAISPSGRCRACSSDARKRCTTTSSDTTGRAAPGAAAAMRPSAAARPRRSPSRSAKRTTSTTAGLPSSRRDTERSRSTTSTTGTACSRASSTSIPTPNEGMPAYATTTFAELAGAEVAQLTDRMRKRSVKHGQALVCEDDRGVHLYVVLAGAVKTARPGEFGQEALVSIMRTGDFFGELALFDGSPRSASATALEDTRAALLARDDFLAFLEAHPAAVRVVLDALAKTIRRLSDRVEDLIFLDVPSRVAKYLLDLAQVNGTAKLELTLTQDELAAFIGASRVSVNRVLGDLERREIIGIRRRHIVIVDPERLSKEIRV